MRTCPLLVVAVAAASTAAALPAPSHAETAWLMPNATWQLQGNVAALAESPIGEALLERIRVDEPNFDDFRFGLTDALGVDPLEDVGEVVLCGNYAQGDRSVGVSGMLLLAEMKGGGGNLEGWMLGLPGYRSEDLDDQTLLHSFFMNADDVARDDSVVPVRVWVALPVAAGDTTLVAATDRDAAERLARRVQREGVDLARGRVTEGGRVATLSLRELASIAVPEGEVGSAVVRSLDAASLTLRSSDALGLDLELLAATPARAQQVAQMVRGLLAFSQVLAVENPEAQPLVDLANEVRVEVDRERVTARFEGDHEELLDLIEALQ